MISERKLVFIAGVFLAMLLACILPSQVPTPDNLPALFETALQPSPTSTSTLEPAPESTLQSACAAGNCAGACIAKLSSFLESTGKPGSPPRATFGHQENPNQQIIMVIYNVNGDEIASPQLTDNLPATLVPYQQDTITQTRIWKYFITMIPPERRTVINRYIIFTDGIGGALASVEEASNDVRHWGLSVDILD